MQISEVINNINAALNYPSATIEDLKLFMDQAISEINSELHIAIPSITDMQKATEMSFSNSTNLVLLTTKPDSSTTIPIYTGTEEIESNYYYDAVKDKYAIKKTNGVVYSNDLYGLYNDYISPPILYEAVLFSQDLALWYIPNEKDLRDFDLEDYLPRDWIFLYFIPYVCFKYAVRDGDTGALFSDEFTQGFQQLRNAYSIPNNVNLKNVCHLFAYKDLAQENIDNLNIIIPTRAITDKMKVPDSMKAIWGDNFYSNGGWGL